MITIMGMTTTTAMASRPTLTKTTSPDLGDSEPPGPN